MSVYIRKKSVGKSFKHSRSHVEVYGYIPRSVQVKNMLTAGKSLDAYRSGLYLYNAGSFENFSADPSLLAAMSPVYNDKLSAFEKKAFIAGLSRGYNDFIASCTDDDKKAKAKVFKNSLFGTVTVDTSKESGS